MTQAQTASGRPRLAARPAALAARAMEVGLVIILAWLAAQAVWFLAYGSSALDIEIDAPSATGPGPVRAGIETAGPALGLFAARDGASQSATAAPAPETRLDITLRGLRSGAGGAAGSAVIETPQRGQRSIAVGDEIAPGVTLAEVHDDHVIIDRSGARESVFITQAAAERARARRAQAGGDAVPASGAAMGEDDASPPRGRPDPRAAAALSRRDWVDGLRLAPVLRAGAVQGFEVRQTSSAAVLRASGLLPGDVVMRLNGQTLSEAGSAAAAMRSLEGAERVELTILRNNEEMTLTAPLN